MTVNEQTIDETSIATVDGAGGPATVTDKDLKKAKDELSAIGKASGWNINMRRVMAEETRFNIWPGQSSDGRKHSKAQDGRPAFPFEGASDVRLRLADMLVNESVMVLTAAAVGNRPQVTSLELNNAGLGQKLSTLLRWVLANKLGANYVREVVKLAQYQEGDSPAGAVLGIWWDQQTALEMVTVTMEQIKGTLLAPAEQGGIGMQPEQVAQLEAQLLDPEKDEQTAEALTELLDLEHLDKKRVGKIVSDLREDGKASYPKPYLRIDQPRVCAYRLFDDLFIPTNTTDLQTFRGGFIREWVTEVQLRERQNTYNYTTEFVNEVLKHEGQSAFPQYRRSVIGELEQMSTNETSDQRRGLYEVFTFVYWAVNDDNVPGLYYFALHNSVDQPAHDRQLLEFDHGCVPLVWFGREILSSRLMDSRGIPEVVATDQYALKLLDDSFNDYTTLSTVPPLKVPANRSKLQLVIGPLKKIEERRPGEVSWMQPPVYPAANEKMQELRWKRINEYFGRIAENVPATLTQLHMQHKTRLFLASLTDALTQLLQLCQQFISDTELELITGDDGVPIARSREEIQGKFRVELSFDPRHLDLEYVKQIAELIQSVILPMDTLSTVQRDQVVKWLFMAINPFLATHSLVPANTAQQSEINDEENNFTKIAAGIEPAMSPEGQNFGLRLQVLQGIAKKNPDAIAKLSPVSKEIYEARVKHLYEQNQQFTANAQMGRTVGKPVLGQPMNAAAMSQAQGTGAGVSGQAPV